MSEANDLCIVWYHPPTDTLFQWGHLEAMFCALMSPGQGTLEGVPFSSWRDFEIIGLIEGDL